MSNLPVQASARLQASCLDTAVRNQISHGGISTKATSHNDAKQSDLAGFFHTRVL